MRRVLFGSFCSMLVVACVGDPPAPLGSSVDAAADAGSAVDAAPDVVTTTVGCTDTELDTDAGAAEIRFELGANPRQYTNRCRTVKAGTAIQFIGSFSQHPLVPSGGDTPSPIPYTNADQPGNELSVTFATPGLFGFECEFHPRLMFGAVRVVP